MAICIDFTGITVYELRKLQTLANSNISIA